MIQGWLILELSQSGAMLIVICGCSNGSTWELIRQYGMSQGIEPQLPNNLPLGFNLLKVLLLPNITILVTSL